jgi:large repetitive protein
MKRFAGGVVIALFSLLPAVPATAALSSDMFVIKTAPATANVGTNVTFTVTLGNAPGSDDAPAATFTDNLPADGTFVSIVQTSGPSFPPCSTPSVGASGGTVICTIALLAGGDSATFDIVVNVSAGAAGTTLINTVTASSANPDPNSENDTSVTGTSVPGGDLADVSIAKTGPASAAANTDVSYTVTVTNHGPNDAQNVSWTDTLPAGSPPGSPMTFVSFNQTGGPTFNCVAGATTTCTLATLPLNAVATFTLVGHVPPGAATGTIYTNIATVSSANDPTSENDSSATSLTVSSADVGVTKSGPATAVAGGPTYTYTITLSNSGPDPANDAAFADTLPAGVSFVSLVQDTGPMASCAGSVGSSTVSCSIPALGNGQTAQFTLTVQPLPSIPNGTVINNTATASTSSADSNPNNNMSTASTTVSTSADVSIGKTGPATGTSGSPITYTITVGNAGPSDAANVSWTDTLPASTTFVSLVQNTGPAFACTTGATVSCSIASLASGATATFALTVRVSPSVAPGTVIGNTASVSTTTTDPGGNNNTSTANATVSTSADVSIGKTGPAAAFIGNPITYTITVGNAGPSDAANVSWTDVLPASTTFVSLVQNTGPAFTCTTGATISCSIASLASGATATFALTVTVSPSAISGTTISNTASVSTTTTDPASNNNTSTANTTVSTAVADVSIGKTGPATALSGANVVYTITVGNAGPSDAANVSWTDVLPASTTFVSLVQNTGPAFTCTTGATISCSIASLASGAAATFTLTVRIASSVASGTVISNTATVSSTTADPAPTNNSATAPTTINVTLIDPPTITKIFGAGNVALGQTTTMTFTITNPNPATVLTGVAVTDPLPAGLVVGTPNNLSNSCGGTATAVEGSSSVSLTGGTLAAGASCTVSVNVVSRTAGTITNVTGPVTSTNGGTGGTASAVLNVAVAAAPIPALSPWAFWLLAALIASIAVALLRRRTGHLPG